MNSEVPLIAGGDDDHHHHDEDKDGDDHDDDHDDYLIYGAVHIFCNTFLRSW